MSATVLDRMHSHGPKKILASDGGGILGLMSVEILAKIEADLRVELRQPNLVLADYFDFVCHDSETTVPHYSAVNRRNERQGEERHDHPPHGGNAVEQSSAWSAFHHSPRRLCHGERSRPRPPGRGPSPSS